MKHVIIGTAGHVDHGKTLLVKALTGIDTDRLKEEKKRGITIELGFAHLDWPDGTQAGIVDVPGHEKFIKNMLAGAGGIDLAMLIIAADDGVMPQTVEHLDILTLLGIKDGLIVITKADTVDPEWLELMQEEIREKTKGSFLEGKPIVAVSAYTGQGIPELKAMLRHLVQDAEEKSLRIPFRLPVDRVFSVEGFGTVVTGTLIEGAVNEGDPAELVPSGLQTRIRNLQVHGKNVETAYAGQRVAINLAGLKKEEIQRGDCVAKPGSVRISRMLDVRLQNLKDSGRVIKNDSQIHLFHGAAERLAKVVLFGREELKPGESCYAQLRLTEPIATKNADRFVVRFFSPMETIGGGIILDKEPKYGLAVTGFGMLGHTYEMAQGSDVEITLNVDAIDLIPEALELARIGILPAGMCRNRKFAEAGVDAGSTELVKQDMLYDPQTAGGLLMAVAQEDADALFEELKTTVPSAQRIGTVAEYQGGKRIKLR